MEQQQQPQPEEKQPDIKLKKNGQKNKTKKHTKKITTIAQKREKEVKKEGK